MAKYRKKPQKCQICGKEYTTKALLTKHLADTACGTIDTTKSLICGITYKQASRANIVVPLKITLSIEIVKIEALAAENRGSWSREDKEIEIK